MKISNFDFETDLLQILWAKFLGEKLNHGLFQTTEKMEQGGKQLYLWNSKSLKHADRAIETNLLPATTGWCDDRQ